MQEIQQSTKVEGHIQALQQMHDDLDRQIKEEYIRYGNDALVQTLKKKKLQLKDEIEQYKKDMATVGESVGGESVFG
jgi:hypothetical protein